MVINTRYKEYFGSFKVSVHPKCLKDDDFQYNVTESESHFSKEECCDYCGLPLDPKMVKKALRINDLDDSEIERLERAMEGLYGPVGSVYRLHRSVTIVPVSVGNEKGEPISEEYYPHYQVEGKKYHPYCYEKVMEDE